MSGLIKILSATCLYFILVTAIVQLANGSSLQDQVHCSKHDYHNRSTPYFALPESSFSIDEAQEEEDRKYAWFNSLNLHQPSALFFIPADGIDGYLFSLSGKLSSTYLFSSDPSPPAFFAPAVA